MSRPLPTILYLCDGKAPNCKKTCCAHNGMGDCRHTTQWEHALHKDADVSKFEMVPAGEDRLLFVEPYDAD